MQYFLKKIHITPDDYLIRINECYDGKHNHIDYFIEPYGPYQQNEMSDTIYEDEDSVISYHEHTKGVETFVVDGGRVEVTSCGKKAIATKGDMVQIPTGVPHKFRWIDAGTVWREMYQETQMNEDMMALWRHRDFHMDTFDEDMNGKGNESYWCAFDPVAVDVPKEEHPLIRTYHSGIQSFEWPGCRLHLKVGRWETKNVKEVWEIEMEQGFQIHWNEMNPYYRLFIVQEGPVEVRLDGEGVFTANTRDILHIPNHIAGEITAKEGKAVLFDYNCEGYMYRAMEELYAMQVREPEKLESEAEKILLGHGCYVRGSMMK